MKIIMNNEAYVTCQLLKKKRLGKSVSKVYNRRSNSRAAITNPLSFYELKVKGFSWQIRLE